MKVLSYNLKKNAAVSELKQLVDKQGIDVLCLQEVDVHDLPKSLGHLSLAIGTQTNRLGLAVYMDTEKYSINASHSFGLKKSVYDRIASPAHERLLGVNAIDMETNRSFTVGSFHASPLTALNSIRRHQIKAGLASLDELATGSPLLMIGDFNYPIFQKRLQLEMSDLGYDLTLSDAETYLHYKVVKGHFDFVTSRDLVMNSVKTLTKGLSDHLPILAQTSFTSA